MATLTPAEFRAMTARKTNKYNVAAKEQRTYGGRVYASAAEMRYAQQLDVWKMAGAVKDWFPQVPFVLHAPGGKALGKYLADFKVLWADGSITFVDTKGFETPLFKWKRKHVEAEFSVCIQVVK